MKKLTNEDITKAHEFCTCHREAIQKDEKCGCFYCMRIFSPKEIFFWIDREKTALCPHCGIDAVIGESSGYPINEEFLKTMNKYWFATAEPIELIKKNKKKGSSK